MGLINWYLGVCDRWLPGYSRPETDDEPAPCARCDEMLEPDQSVCPECQNYPAKSAKWSGIGLMFAGFVLSLTGVGAIVGIPLFIAGLIVRLGAGSISPTEHDFGSSA